MNVNQNVSLNLTADGIPPRLHMVQGDSNTRTIVASLWDDSQPYNVPASAAVMMRFRKPDGTGGLYDVTEGGAKISVSGNVVTVPVATQLLTVAGVVFAQVDVYDTTTIGKAAEKLATFRFAVEVTPSVYPDAEIISSDYYNIIAADIGKAVAAAARAEAAQASASAAQQGAEAARNDAVNAETAAESAKTAAVAAQKKSESAQTKAEAAWTASEQSAAAAQTAKEGAETAQSGAQAAKTAAESAKGAAQAAQTGAETARTGAEAANGAAEDSAEDAEAWAVGQRNGVDVPSIDPTYRNNAKYYKDQAQTIAGGKYVSYGVSQSLTAEQQAQARDNINAPAPYEAGDNISITGRIITTKAFPCNPNLLDNWYFGKPVNQRGQTSYTGAYLYTIDRWITQNTITVVDGGITVRRTIGAHAELFLQPLDDALVKAIAGKTVTYSALTTNGLFSKTYLCKSDASVVWDTDDAVQGDLSMDIYGNASDLKWLRFYSGVIGTEATIIAVKLELGPQQTLAHQENGVWALNEIPKYGDQLAECQRYYRPLFKPNRDYAVMATATAEGTLHVDYALNPPMRTTPALVGDTHGALRIVAYNVNDLSVAIVQPCDYIAFVPNGGDANRLTLNIVPTSGVSLVGKYCFTVDTFDILTEIGLSADL